MKKSEFEQKRIARYKPPVLASASLAAELVRRDVDAAEAAGVTWDPEELEPTPKRGSWGFKEEEQAGESVKLPTALSVGPNGAVCSAGSGRYVFGNAAVRGRAVDFEPVRVAEEMVRRYNEWPGLISRVCEAEGESEHETGRAEKAERLAGELERRAIKAEAEVKRFGGVIDGYCKADTKLRADLRDALDQVDYLGKVRRGQGETIISLRRQLDSALTTTAEAVTRRRGHVELLTLERDALKLAVQEGEREVARLRVQLLRESDRLRADLNLALKSERWEADQRELANQEIERLRRHAGLVQDFLSGDKETFKRSLRELLRLAAEADGEEVTDGN